MSQKIIVHIGLPKTATSVLQESVFPRLSNYVLLKAPYTQENIAFNQLQYADDTLYSSSLLYDELRFIKQQNPNKNILVSDEHLSGDFYNNAINRSLIAKRLGEVCPDAVIILFLRGQRAAISSLYNQTVKIGLFSQHFNSRFITAPGEGMKWADGQNEKKNWDRSRRYIDHFSNLSTENFRYSPLVELYKNSFNDVRVFLYEDLVLYPDRVLTELEDVLEEELPEDVKKGFKREQVNPSLSLEDLAYILMKNRLRGLTRFADSFLGHVISSFYGWIKQDAMQIKMNRYLDELMGRASFSEDNKKLNDIFALGMERHPDKYFEDL